MTTPLPDRYFVVGHPVEHSLSPSIHAAFARQTGQELVYGRCLSPLDGFEATVRALAADHTAGRVRGCNVTIPFKFEAAALARECSARARLAGAANVLCFDTEGWFADNTDGVGLMADLQRNEGLDLAGRQVLVVGAGGAAAGVLGPLLESAPERVLVANRTAAKAQELVRRHAPLAASRGVALGHCALHDLAAAAPAAGFDLLLDASAASLSGESLPVPDQALAAGWVAVDLMYGPPAAAFLAWARDRSASRAVDGLGMLVEQAAEAFALWRGVRPDTAPVLASLRATAGGRR
jgi:shikimate dehydrogenase